MTMASKSDKKDRNRKSGSNARYINEHRHEKSHIRRITKHLVMHPADKKAVEELKRYKLQGGMFH
jgi:hypothetical protein